jgi:predicted HAD superfamily Cof-like phosphohydrolase
MQKQLESVGTFHKANLVQESETPTLISEKQADLRYKLGLEELNEYKEAVEKNDLVGILDAITDQLYILAGTIRVHGMQHIIEKAFDEVQRSNLSKLDENGNPIINQLDSPYYNSDKPLGKILKSKMFIEPNLNQFL